MTDESFEYVGTELDLFADAANWREYWGSRVKPYLGNDVLEIGAGLGSVARLLRVNCRSWTAVEPDEDLARQIPTSCDELPVSVVVGTVESVPPDPAFDSVLYIDVLEHIDDDHAELTKALARLRPGGHLIVLAPAHQWLFSPFDAAIGHFRRYDKRSLRAVRPDGCREARAEYLDVVGIVVSASNRLLLRSSMPTRDQVQLWDRRIVPVSKVLDPVTGRTLGKSLLVVWQKQADHAQR